MIHQSFPEAAQRAAGHCDALLTRRLAPAELAAEFAGVGERLAGALRSALATACGDPSVQVRSLGARPVPAAGLSELCGPLAAISLHGFGQGEQHMLLSLEARALLEQLDRAFGGSGDLDGDLPGELPFSADLLARRLESQAIAAIAGELTGVRFRAGDRGSAAARLSPFAATAELTLIEFEIAGSIGSKRPWRILLAVETEALPVLLPRRAGPQPAIAARRSEPGDAPFADLPLSASATLVDMNVPLHRLAALQPGTVLPIIVARSVPLHIGETIVARGTIGEVDDQVALQITQTFSGKETQ